MKKLKQMPIPVAVLIMVLCIVIGIGFGNNNALSKAESESAGQFATVLSSGKERADKAANLRSLCESNGVDQSVINTLNTAISAVKAANAPAKFAKANEELTVAMDAAEEALLESREGTVPYLQAALDDIDSVTMQLARYIRVYNESQQNALDLYNTLPARFILQKPEVI